MSDATFVKGPCQHCGGRIEFPAAGLGRVVNCPHCGQRTRLEIASAIAQEPARQTPPPPPHTPPPIRHAPHAHTKLVSPLAVARKRARMAAAAAASVALLAAGGIAFWKYKDADSARPDPDSTPAGNAPAVPGAKRAADNANAPGRRGDDAPAAVATTDSAEAEAAKRIEDFKPGPVKLEKAKNSSLVHAVGSLRNESTQRRFGVKVEIELLDAAGRPLGTATDYAQVLEPREEWRFRALVLHSKAVNARLARITEEE
jgi:hypothetical protein